MSDIRQPNALIGFRFPSTVTELFHFDWKHLRQCETLNAHVHALKIFLCRIRLVTANKVACNFKFFVFVIETGGHRGRGLISMWFTIAVVDFRFARPKSVYKIILKVWNWNIIYIMY